MFMQLKMVCRYLIWSRPLALNNACKYLVEVISLGGQILLVGTKAQAAETIKSEAERLGVALLLLTGSGTIYQLGADQDQSR